MTNSSLESLMGKLFLKVGLVLVVAVLAVALWLRHQEARCEAKLGVLVKGMWNNICIRAEVIE